MPRIESRRTVKARQAAGTDSATIGKLPPPPDTTQPAETPADTATPPPASEAASTPKLALTLKPDGTIDTETMRSGTREKLKTALADSSLFPRLGLGAPAEASSDSVDKNVFYPMLGGIVYDSLSKVMMLMALRAGYPKEQVLALAFTPEEISKLTPLTAKVIEKWLPVGGKYADEMMLGIMLCTMLGGKIQVLQKPAKVIPMPVPPAERTDAPA